MDLSQIQGKGGGKIPKWFVIVKSGVKKRKIDHGSPAQITKTRKKASEDFQGKVVVNFVSGSTIHETWFTHHEMKEEEKRWKN